MIGRVVRRAAAIFRQAPLAVILVALVCSAAPGIWIDHQVDLAAPLLATPYDDDGLVASILIWMLPGMLLEVLTTGALTGVALARTGGPRARPAAIAGLLALGVVAGLAITVGYALLIVPGVALSVIWSVAAPAMVAERRGVRAALKRSRELTAGARWVIVGLFAVIMVASISVEIGAWLVGEPIFGDLDGVAAGPGGGLSPAELAVLLPMRALTAALSGVIQIALFLELRERRDGPAADALADIFA